MLIRYKDQDSQDWENVSVKNIHVTIDLEDVIFGDIRMSPTTELASLLKSGDRLDVEFSRATDDDFDVVILSGIVMTGESFGSGEGFEEPLTVYHFESDSLQVHD
jgi:hypothetical protein